MKTFNVLFAAIVFLGTTSLAQEKSKLPSKEEVLKAVEIFVKSPLSADGKVAAGTIAKFAEESHDVAVTISPRVTPWVASGKPSKFSDTLLAAYIVGNVQSQLERRIKGNDSYAGIQQVMKTYAQLKKSDKTLEIPEIQKFVDLERKKELKK